MYIYQKTPKIDKFQKGTPYVFFIKKHSKLTNFKRVPPMFFYQKTLKIDKFQKGTSYAFLSKTPKIDKFEKYSYLKKVFV